MDNQEVDSKVVLLQRKAALFFNENKKVHITLSNRRFWRRGYIVEIKGDYFVIFDDKKKVSEIIFFFELHDIRQWVEKDPGADNE